MSTTSSWIGTTFVNGTILGEHQTATRRRTDRIWLLHLRGSNASNLENTPSLPSLEDDDNPSSALYITNPRKHNSASSSRTSQTSEFSDNTDGDTLGMKLRGIYTADDVSQSDRHGRVSAVVNRDWRRTAQVMPSMDEFGKSSGRKSREDHEPISSVWNSVIGRTSYSVVHEASDRFSASDSAVSNMEMQGNRRTSRGFHINTPNDKNVSNYRTVVN